MTRILMVRHGETEYNNSNRFAGQGDINLNEKGFRQVEKLRERLASEKIDTVYASDLRRARITAEMVVSGRGLQVIECPELREINYGEIEGLTYAEIRQKYPLLVEKIHTADLTMTFPGGESLREFTERVVSFKERLVRHRASENIFIAAHGGPLRTLIISLLGIGQECWRQLRIDNASLSIIDIYPPMKTDLETSDRTTEPRAILSLFNETSFLAEKTSHQ